MPNSVSNIDKTRTRDKESSSSLDSKHTSFYLFSPLKQEDSAFEELGQWLKRQSVAIDVINFAHPENVSKLTALVTAANSSENSHFLDVPLGVAMITDVLIASPLINPDEGGMGNAGGAGAGVGAAGAGAS